MIQIEKHLLPNDEPEYEICSHCEKSFMTYAGNVKHDTIYYPWFDDLRACCSEQCALAIEEREQDEYTHDYDAEEIAQLILEAREGR